MKVAFAIVSANYLPFAGVLAESFLRHHPEYSFYVGVLEKKEVALPDSGNLKLLYVEDLGIPELADMLSRYNIFELSCALKPFYADYFISRLGAREVLYFDSDMVVYGRLRLFEQHPDDQIFLTPHLLAQDGLNKHSELQMLAAGVFNGGFFAVRAGDESRQFLTWWKERMAEFSYQGKPGLFVDQIWLNFVPAYFGRVNIIFDPGYNVAYWNLSNRKISRDGGTLRVNNSHELLFFHFSGFKVSIPDRLSVYDPTIRLADFPEVAALAENYRQALITHPYGTLANHKPTLGNRHRVRPDYKNEHNPLLRFLKKLGYLTGKVFNN
ncbi:MAG: hypothetical protein ACK5DD_06780 [Cyclobacteriaceae bacterium]|jgi:hypothetical protein